MSICYQTSIVLDLSPGAVHGQMGLGTRRLRFSLAYRVPGWKDVVYHARSFRGEVAMLDKSGKKHLLGIAFPESAWVVRTYPTGSNSALLFELDLSPEQLAKVEELRNGADAQFDLKVVCEVYQFGNPECYSGTDTVRFRVDRTMWAEVLKGFGLDRLAILEVQLPPDSAEFETAVTLLRRARDELDAGNYDAVVQQCRRALESAAKVKRLSSDVRAAVELYSRGDRKRMSKRQRALLVSHAALHFAHPAHHVDETGAIYEFGRRDAWFMLTLASAVVANWSNETPPKKRREHTKRDER